ncbi:glycosyltransferase [Flavobacteriales bacterium]|nr:glycosyltransferase [Flavobacteriales bacterium]
MKKILYSVLNWGLGHASRSVTVIEYLINQGHEVHLASDGVALDFLQRRFPNSSFVELPAYDVKYSKGKSLIWKLLLQSPYLLKTIQQEKSFIKKLHKKEQFDLVISDNRFGSNINDIPSVYITHQVTILSKIGQNLLKKLHAKIINQFDECWIPDYKGESNLAGELSQNSQHLSCAVHYIGRLSHLKLEQVEKDYDVAYILSGPEPQRSILEKKIIEQHSKKQKAILVQGTLHKAVLYDHVEVVDLLDSKGLKRIISRSKKVVCRSGYSSIMDFCNSEIPVMMIATPGQSEQEYLADRLHARFENTQEQKLLDLNRAKYAYIEINLEDNSEDFRLRIKNILV